MDYCDHCYMGMHFFWWIFWILLIVGIMFFIYKFLNMDKVYKEKSNKPLEILKHRFAKGEISEEEYLAKKKIIENDESSS